MIKDIVVSRSVDKTGSTASDYAVSVASMLEAHITGIAFAYDPIDLVSHLGYIATDVVEAQWRDYKARQNRHSTGLGKQPREPVSRLSR